MSDKGILVIGAGIAGMEASLVLANAGKTVYLVEKDSYIGGNVIKYEDVFSNMECATCLLAPIQQELLQNENIKLYTLSEVVKVKGESGNFVVNIKKKARYVNMENCIGCNECFNVCPVSLKNDFEQGLSMRNAIYTPCAGALPNVPRIDTDNCIRFKGKECEACKEACAFEAIEFDQKDEELEINVESIIIATGFSTLDPKKIPKYGYGIKDIYTAFEFERIYASNGPTEGKLILKNKEVPKNAVIVLGVGLENYKCPASICTMYSLKFIHYLKHKIEDINITLLYKELCVPCKSCQQFMEKIKATNVNLIRADDIEISEQNGKKIIKYKTEYNEEKSIDADIVIIATPIQPSEDTGKIAKMFNITQSSDGFYNKNKDEASKIISEKQGVYIIGCASGPKDIQESITEAQAAAGRILSLSNKPVVEVV